MKDKHEIVDNWLPRYTGVPLDGFGEHILLTNFGGYLSHFSEMTGAPVVGTDRPFPSATADGITLINFGMGSPNAATIMDVTPEVKYYFAKGFAATLGVVVPVYTRYEDNSSEKRDVTVNVGLFKSF